MVLVLTADESEALAGITTVTGVAVGIIAIVVLIAIIISFIMGRRLMTVSYTHLCWCDPCGQDVSA